MMGMSPSDASGRGVVVMSGKAGVLSEDIDAIVGGRCEEQAAAL